MTTDLNTINSIVSARLITGKPAAAIEDSKPAPAAIEDSKPAPAAIEDSKPESPRLAVAKAIASLTKLLPLLEGKDKDDAISALAKLIG